MLDERASRLKQKMLDCFSSQHRVFASIRPDLEVERFRLAPDYDFNEPPHVGPLLYETQDWVSYTGPQWRAIASKASNCCEINRFRDESGQGTN